MFWLNLEILLITERHSLFDASELTATVTPTTSTNSGQDESPLPDSGTVSKTSFDMLILNVLRIEGKLDTTYD